MKIKRKALLCYVDRIQSLMKSFQFLRHVEDDKLADKTEEALFEMVKKLKEYLEKK